MVIMLRDLVQQLRQHADSEFDDVVFKLKDSGRVDEGYFLVDNIDVHGNWGEVAHPSPHFKCQMTPNIPRYTRCSISIRPNASINARTRYSGQFAICSYSINP